MDCFACNLPYKGYQHSVFLFLLEIMKLTFPCEYGDRDYNSKTDGPVWCESLMKDKNFSCPHITECMCRVEDALQKVMTVGQKTSLLQEQTEETIVRELISEKDLVQSI